MILDAATERPEVDVRPATGSAWWNERQAPAFDETGNAQSARIIACARDKLVPRNHCVCMTYSHIMNTRSINK